MASLSQEAARAFESLSPEDRTPLGWTGLKSASGVTILCYPPEIPRNDVNALVAAVKESIGRKRQDPKHANTLISMIRGCTSAAPDLLPTLDRLLDGAVECHLLQFSIMDRPAPRTSALGIPPFHVGPFRPESLGPKLQFAGSVEFIDLGRHAKKLCVWRAPRPLRLVGWNHAVTQASSGWKRFIDAYFRELAADFRETFWAEFVAAQDLAVAAGAEPIDDRQLRSDPGIRTLSVFDCGRTCSWYLIEEARPQTIHLPEPEQYQPYLTRVESLRGESVYGLSPVLKLFAAFVAQSKRMSALGFADQALLHAVIAMELLLAEGGDAISDKVRRRAAVIANHELGIDLSEAEKEVKELYDARSRYVHDGVRCDEDSIKKAGKYNDALLSWMLRLHEPERQKRLTGNKLGRKVLLERLDHLSSGMKLGVDMDKGLVEETLGRSGNGR